MSLQQMIAHYPITAKLGAVAWAKVEARGNVVA
jgi:hypothetical protein